MQIDFDRSSRLTKSEWSVALLLILLITGLACSANAVVTVTPVPTAITHIYPTDTHLKPQGVMTVSPSPTRPGLKATATFTPLPLQPAAQDAGVVVGGWYGPACDEAEGTFIYRWSVDLMKDPVTGRLAGTVKFHDCPGGGRVLYYVTGDPQTGPVFTLSGEKKEGGGDLFNSAPITATFTFDGSAGQIIPNFAP